MSRDTASPLGMVSLDGCSRGGCCPGGRCPCTGRSLGHPPRARPAGGGPVAVPSRSRRDKAPGRCGAAGDRPGSRLGRARTALRRSSSHRRPLDGALVPGKARRGPTARPGRACGAAARTRRPLPLPPAPTGTSPRQLRPGQPVPPPPPPRRRLAAIDRRAPGAVGRGDAPAPAPLGASGRGRGCGWERRV